MSLADRLRIVRGSMGQTEFAKKIGSSQSGISAYEKGQRKPDYETLIRVSTEFGVTLDWLLLGKGSMHPADQLEGAMEEKTTDMSVVLKGGNIQHSDFTERPQNKTADMSVVWDLQQKLLEALQEQNNLLRENAHLRLQLERRDMRIRDLEREVAELREARKGPSAYGAGVAGSAG